MAEYFEILCGIAAALLLLYYYSTRNFDYWRKQGVPGPKPMPFFGSMVKLIFATTSAIEYSKHMYEKYKNEQMVGLYLGNVPVLLLRDPELIKDVFIRDFNKFEDRGIPVQEKAEPLSQNLVLLEPKRWKPLRSKMTPMFTSAKLKEMLGLILECSEHIERYLDKIIGKEEIVEIQEIAAKFTTDVIGSCVFGIEMNALSEEESEFREIGRVIFAPSFLNTFREVCNHFVPNLYNIFGRFLPDKVTPFFTKLLADTMAYRQKNNIHRPDFIQMLMELRDHPQKLDDIELTDVLLAAQAFIFFAAGFETSAATMSNALYELAQNHDVQERLRDEIRAHDETTNGILKYEDIERMKYLDKVFKETLRKFPPVAITQRKVTADHMFDGAKVTVLKDMKIWLPILSIHRDPDVYPNPDVFDPERFNEDAVKARHPMHFIPFGGGPRNCIGARFGVYQSKVGLITILRSYKVDVCEKTIIPYSFQTTAFLLLPVEGIYLKLTKLRN